MAKDFLVSSEEFSLMKCTVCGFIMTVNPPDERDMKQYYLSEDYISHSDRKQNLTEDIYHLVRHIMLGRKYLLMTSVCKTGNGSLLDIGSGTGYFAGYAKTRGWEVTGIEISERARNYSFSKFGVNAISPDKVKNLHDKEFTCITLWHVLEHLNEPDLWLREISRILKDEGKCIVALPNINSSDSSWFGKDWAALDVPRHLWHFSPDTFIRFIQGNGFRCIKTKSMPFDVFYISIMSYRNQNRSLAFLRGMATGMILTIKNLFVRNSASSLIYVIEKQ